jgi:hypothetical protein
MVRSIVAVMSTDFALVLHCYEQAQLFSVSIHFRFGRQTADVSDAYSGVFERRVHVERAMIRVPATSWNISTSACDDAPQWAPLISHSVTAF